MVLGQQHGALEAPFLDAVGFRQLGFRGFEVDFR